MLKRLRYVYDIPNAFIGGILHAEPKKIASVVKRKTRHALGIAVDFVGDPLKDKKVTEFNTLVVATISFPVVGYLISCDTSCA